jgi:broad specificity phosphatase PhoE
MAELWLIRHAQASFGAADYDKLSDLGHAQSRALGLALKALGARPDAVFIGGQRRHRETWEGINTALGFPTAPGILPGFNEFDFAGLLNARYRGQERPRDLHTDRKLHFKMLRETVLEWQTGAIIDPPEPYATFAARVRDARAQATAGGKEQVIVVTSGGAIGQTVAEVMGAPADAMIRLQLQIKNCSVSRIVVTPRGEHLGSFNETPHITAANVADMLTYS